MFMKSLIVFILLPSSFILSACSSPHRHAESSKTIEWFDQRPDGLTCRETWRDSEKGGGQFLFTDPSVQAMVALHTNQTALGGGSLFSAGTVTINVDSNTAAIVGAAGTATGNIIGAAAKSSLK
jgi:hypothetical protein